MIEQVALVSALPNEVTERPYVFEENGITFTGELTFEQWLECGDVIGRIGKGVHWWVGDWINYGRPKWDHTPRYQEAIKRTGFEYQTLKHDVAIASTIDKCRRRHLSHSHHAEVAPYTPEEQDMLLDQAESQGWTRKQLRREKKPFLASIVQASPVEEMRSDPRIPPIYHCPIAKLHEHVEANSVDVIITDPPYPREFLYVYDDLAQFAIHALKDGGSLITMIGQSYLPEILDKLRKEPLTYHWFACYYITGYTTKQWQRNIGIAWKPLLWFVKGKYTGPWRKDADCYENTFDPEYVFIGNKKDKKYHAWGQPESDMANIIERFTQEGQLICDPFVGGGATAVAALDRNRRFIGCDIKEECVKTTRKRIDEALAAREEVSA